MKYRLHRLGMNPHSVRSLPRPLSNWWGRMKEATSRSLIAAGARPKWYKFDGWFRHQTFKMSDSIHFHDVQWFTIISPVKINYSNLCYVLGSVHYKFDVKEVAPRSKLPSEPLDLNSWIDPNKKCRTQLHDSNVDLLAMYLLKALESYEKFVRSY